MEIKNLSFSFNRENFFFKDFNLSFETGRTTVLLGPSGCGKSTLLKLMAGLLQPGAGSFVSIDRFSMGFVFQDSTLLPWKNLEKNIMLPRLISGSKDSDLNLELVKTLGLIDHLQKYPHQLSGGQRMRGSLARALINSPNYLLLDEPFSALDEPTRNRLQDEWLLWQTQKKMTTLFVTHSFNEAVYLADEVVILTASRPVQARHKVKIVRNFQTRFEMNYLEQVKNIAQLFEQVENDRKSDARPT